MSQTLDQYDYKILVKLIENGRISFSAIAKELGITDVAIKKRFENLISKGIIKRVSVILDYKILGIEGEAMVFVKSDLLATDKNIATLQENDFVRTVYKTFGEYNLVFIYLLKDLSVIDVLEKTIAKLQGVENFKFLIISKTVFDRTTIPKTSLQIYYRQ